MGTIKMKAKWLGSALLLASLYSVSAVAVTGTCYQSQLVVGRPGHQESSTLTLLWMNRDNYVDGLLVKRPHSSTLSDLFCSSIPPIRCALSDDGGRVQLIWRGSSAVIDVPGQFFLEHGDDGDFSVQVKSSKHRQSYTLNKISNAECQALFPHQEQRRIRFDNNSSHSGSFPGAR